MTIGVDHSIPLASGWLGSRELSEDTVLRCISATDKKEVESLWGCFKDCLFGTDRQAAKSALSTMAHTTCAEERFNAIAQFMEYVSPAYGDKVNWRVRNGSSPVLEIAGHDVPDNTDWGEITTHPPRLSAQVSCRLLCALEHRNQNVVTAFHMLTDKVVLDRSTESLLTNGADYLSANPELLDALTAIGLDTNDAENEFAKRIAHLTGDAIWASSGSEHLAKLASANAFNIAVVATRLTSSAPDTRTL